MILVNNILFGCIMLRLYCHYYLMSYLHPVARSASIMGMTSCNLAKRGVVRLVRGSCHVDFEWEFVHFVFQSTEDKPIIFLEIINWSDDWDDKWTVSVH